jgi:hypothetical protein
MWRRRIEAKSERNGMSTTYDAPVNRGGGTVLLLLIAWLWVGVPLAWGVKRTVTSALKLFTASAPTTQVAPAAPEAPTSATNPTLAPDTGGRTP